MPVITFKDVALDTSSDDREGRLVFADDVLAAVLVRLATERGGVAKPGDWFLEAGFGACGGSGEIFGSLDDARAWVLEQIGRGQSPPLRTKSHDEKPEDCKEEPLTTLGDLLGRGGSSQEQDWAKLIRSIAAGDQAALHALYERAHRVVFTLAQRITADRGAAEKVTIDAFHAIWRHAPRYVVADGTVLAWVMNQTRARAIDHLRNEKAQPETDIGAPGVLELPERGQALQARLAQRIAEETSKPVVPPPARRWSEPEWEQVGPGIEYKRLSTDTKRHRIGMLVRLAPGASYPAHTHAAHEELHLLDGELWIDGRRFLPGDYNHGAPGAADERVWTETGCTCVLLTSTRDVLRLRRTG